MSDLPEPPYPADTRAKGWRFELDLERVMQSDTWALATPELRPWLLMLWTVAWQQTPCGSMPSDDSLIAARLGMKPAPFKKAKDVLMRGWWLANDRRLYHSTIAERVLDMLGRKEGERKRKADYRARMEAERESERKAAESDGVPGMSRGTDAGQTRDSGGSDATGTGTGTGTGLNKTIGTTHASTDSSRACASPGQLAAAMRKHSIDSQPGDPRIIAAANAGVTVETIEAACGEAKSKKQGQRISAGYVVSIAEAWTREAAAPRPIARGSPQGSRSQSFGRNDRSAAAAAIFGNGNPNGEVIDV